MRNPISVSIRLTAAAMFLFYFAPSFTRQAAAQATGPADLVITTGPPTATPSSVFQGGTVSLSAWTVKNQGGAVAGAFPNGFYLSTDSVITPADVYLGGNSNTGLGVGGSYAWPAPPPLIIPSATPPGIYYIGIMVDITNGVTESDETNNTVFNKIEVLATRPDLMIPSGTPTLTPSSVAAGGNFTVSAWTVKNQGGTAAGAFANGFYLSIDNVITPADVYLGGNSNPLGLAPLASYGWGAQLLTIPPATVAGSYYIGILVDRTGVVAESNETNNYVFNKIDVSASKPDLMIPTGSPTLTPSSVAQGGSFTVSAWTVKNQGGTAAGAFVNGFYLSTDAVITWADVYLGGNSNPLGLASLASYGWGAQTLTIPTATVPGSYYIGILVDRSGAVAESNETNNYVFNKINITASKPDLMIPSGAPTLTPSSVAQGDSFTVSAWTVKNQGGTAAGAFFNGFYLSTDTVITPADVYLGGNSNPLGLASLASYGWGAQTLTIPTATVPGGYYFGILVDRTGAVAESNETNNTVLKKIVVVASKPDLMIPSGTPMLTPSSVAPGGSFTLSAWTVKNQGGTAAGAFSNGFYLSTDNVITPADVYLGGNSNSGLGIGSSFAWGAQTLTIPSATVPGIYFVGILVDRTYIVAESNETNNTVFHKINVLAPRPDLTIISGAPLITPGVVEPGNAVSLTGWTVKNIGPVAAGAFSNGYYLSADSVITSADVYLGGNSNPLGLAALASYAWAGPTLTIPLGTVPGSYYIGILVDRTYGVLEISETNNTVSTTIKIGDDHGNDSSAASPANVNVPISGVIGHLGDLDYFKVTLMAGVTYDIHVTLGTIVDTMLWLYKSDGVTQLGYNDDDPLGGLDSRITYTAATTGSYYIKVSSYYSFYTGSYTLEVTD